VAAPERLGFRGIDGSCQKAASEQELPISLMGPGVLA
jgi:hypothetical protein